jgi:hypothetical protein
MPTSSSQLLAFTGADGRTRVARRVSERVARPMRIVDRAPALSPFARRPMDQPLSSRERLGLAAVFGALALFLAIALVRGDAVWRSYRVTPEPAPAAVPALSISPRA